MLDDHAAFVMAALTPQDREELKLALLQSDNATRQFLGPLLSLEPVQLLLMSFLRDPRSSFEDHVWQPRTQDVLCRLRDSGASVRDIQDEATSVFHQEIQRKQAPVDRNLMAEVDAAQQDGKTKFKRGDHYAAMNAFKKSVEMLVQFHEDDYYGETIDPEKWEEDALRDRYVTLCNNVAVCAIKLHDIATIRLYANKALRVDDTSSKALYALAKANLMENLYGDARSVVIKAVALHPSNEQFPKLLTEIDAAEHKELEQRVEMIAIKNQREVADAEESKRKSKDLEERHARLARSIEVTQLPTLEDNGLAFVRLHTYFMRIKHELRVALDQCYNPDNGELPLFECTLSNGSIDVNLAESVRASSKKVAKNEAAKIAIKTLWDLKREAGKLLPEEQEHWAEYEQALRDGKPLVGEPKDKKPTDPKATPIVDEPELGGVVRLTLFERQMEAVALLNQLKMQRRLESVDFLIKDVSPTPVEPQFQCTCTINGDQLAVATAISKKKSKAEAGRLAMDAAVERGIIEFVRSAPENDRTTEATGSIGSVVATEEVP